MYLAARIYFHITADLFVILLILNIRIFYAKYQSELVDKKKSSGLVGSRSGENLGHALCPLEQSDEAFISVSLLQSQTSEISTVSPVNTHLFLSEQ